MTIDEAIKRMEIIAGENQRVVDTGIVFDDVGIDKIYCGDTEVIGEYIANYKRCAKEHKQLAKWLKELKKYKDKIKKYKEKNEPRLVIYSGDGYADGYLVYDYAECPNCGREFEKYRDEWEMPFCCACGQRLKWWGEE